VVIHKSSTNLPPPVVNFSPHWVSPVPNCRHPQQQLQDAQLSQRDRAAGCVIVFAKSRRLELGDNILWTL